MTAQAVGITGGKGFIGRHLAEALRRGVGDVVLFEGDICNPQDVGPFVERCACILHLAGENRAADERILRVNTRGVENLAAAAERAGGRHVIFASSNMIERRPDCAYSRSKLTGEQRLAALAGVNGCRAAIVRLPNVYGPGSLPFYNSVVATFCWCAANGMADRIRIDGDGSQRVALAPVDRAVAALIACQGQKQDLDRREVPGEMFSIRELADVVCDPERRRRVPTLQAQYAFYADATLPEQKRVREYPLHANEAGSFQELLHEDEVTFGQLSVCAIAPLSTRGGHYHRHKQEWFCMLTGEMALDFYNPDGTYRLTQLLSAERRRFVHVPPPYPHAVRNLGSQIAEFLLVANEVFDVNEPDTYSL
jgi:UDP-2-acetamido-2,6-beta-L-arabino-hexul-4-ose reductase